MTINTINRLGLIKIFGEDAASFLQGQLTNDIQLLGDSWQFSGYCNAKGRLLALLYLWRQNDDFYALLSADLVTAISKRLQMYVLRSKVTIEHIDSAHVGSVQPKTLLPLDCEQELYSMSFNDTLAVLATNEDYLVVDFAHTSTTQADNNDDWEQRCIAQGIPFINVATSEQFIPQMVNLDELNAINYKKGCYTGQEIIARTHYLGKIKSKMFVCEVANSDDINEGDNIYYDASLSKKAGMVIRTSGCSTAVSHQSLLAVLKIDALEQPLYLTANTQIKVSETNLVS